MHKNAIMLYNYPSKTVKNIKRCQKLAKMARFQFKNEGKSKKIFKFFKKYSKKGLTNAKVCSIMFTSNLFFIRCDGLLVHIGCK